MAVAAAAPARAVRSNHDMSRAVAKLAASSAKYTDVCIALDLDGLGEPVKTARTALDALADVLPLNTNLRALAIETLLVETDDAAHARAACRFFAGVAGHGALRALSVRGVRDRHVAHLLDALARCMTLRHLTLPDCVLSAPATDALMRAIGDARRLRTLALEGASRGSDAALRDMLDRNQRLRTLVLDGAHYHAGHAVNALCRGAGLRHVALRQLPGAWPVELLRGLLRSGSAIAVIDLRRSGARRSACDAADAELAALLAGATALTHVRLDNELDAGAREHAHAEANEFDAAAARMLHMGAAANSSGLRLVLPPCDASVGTDAPPVLTRDASVGTDAPPVLACDASVGTDAPPVLACDAPAAALGAGRSLPLPAVSPASAIQAAAKEIEHAAPCLRRRSARVASRT